MTAAQEILTGSGWRSVSVAKFRAHLGPRRVDGRTPRTMLRYAPGSSEPMTDGTAIDLCACGRDCVTNDLRAIVDGTAVTSCAECRAEPSADDWI